MATDDGLAQQQTNNSTSVQPQQHQQQANGGCNNNYQDNNTVPPVSSLFPAMRLVFMFLSKNAFKLSLFQSIVSLK